MLMSSPTDVLRRPVVDFLIIGSMKSGTTTLHRALAHQSEVAMSSWKEPSFFSRDDRWRRGLEWYNQLFPHEGLRGEASTSYTSPRYAAVAAERIHRLAPNARLIYLLRHPIERARSHYRHQVQRRRESRPLVEALGDPRSLYMSQSSYWSCLEPYIERFPRQQILVVRLEDLTGSNDRAWRNVLSHIGLAPEPFPQEAWNVTASKRQYSGLLRWLWDRKIVTSSTRLPPSLGRLAMRLLTRSGPRYETLLAQSKLPLPAQLTYPVWRDIERLEDWLGLDYELWERDDPAG